MRVKWNRSFDGPSSSAGGCSEEPLGLFERRGYLQKPAAGKDEPFKRSWSFRIKNSNAKDKDGSPGAASTGSGDSDKNAFMRMFRFGKDKKKEVGERRMWDAAATEWAVCTEELCQWSSVPLDVSESPEAKRREEALIIRAHTLLRSLEAAPSGSDYPDDADGTVWGVIYCDPKGDTNEDQFKLPRTKLDSPKSRDARGGKFFQNAVLPHFLHPGQELGGGETQADRRALKKLLLNGACPAVPTDNDSFCPVGNCGPSSVERVQEDSGVVSSAESSEGKFNVVQLDPERDVPNAVSEQCQAENSCTEQSGEPACNAIFVVEVNELYQDDCDETVQVTCTENAPNDMLRAIAAEGSQACAKNDDASEVCLPDKNTCAYTEAPDDAEPIDCERRQKRQRHKSASPDSNCEECPAQDEFEFVAAEPTKREERRMSRETVSPVSDISDEFPADLKASFIFLKPDNSGEYLLSPFLTPDDELSCGAFGRYSSLNDLVSIERQFGNAVCIDSDLDSKDMNEPEEREVIIVGHLPIQESLGASDICVISNDVIQSVKCETFVLENEVTLGKSSASSAWEAAPLPPHNEKSGDGEGTHVSAQADSPPSPEAERSTPARDAAADEAADEETNLEASQGSFQDKVLYFNAISTEQQSQHPLSADGGPLSKRPRASRIPTASRLQRPSSAPPAKKESRIPVLTAAPVPAKRSRVAAKVVHITQPSRNCVAQQRQVTPPLTKVTTTAALARDCSSGGTSIF